MSNKEKLIQTNNNEKIIQIISWLPDLDKKGLNTIKVMTEIELKKRN